MCAMQSLVLSAKPAKACRPVPPPADNGPTRGWSSKEPGKGSLSAGLLLRPRGLPALQWPPGSFFCARQALLLI